MRRRSMSGCNACNPLSLNLEIVMKNKWLISLLLLSGLAQVQAQTLRVGLAEDPDALDPTRARSFVGRIVFSALCDKLVRHRREAQHRAATGAELCLVGRPQGAHHQGAPGRDVSRWRKADAAAVKFNIERHKTLPGSNRRGELAPVTSVDVVDAMTVRLNLSAPFAPLLATLTDRAGMMVSPKAAQAEGEKFAANPVSMTCPPSTRPAGSNWRPACGTRPMPGG